MKNISVAALFFTLGSAFYSFMAGSALAGVNPPVKHPESRLSNDSRNVVLIYLANESSGTEAVRNNVAAVQSILLESKTKVGEILSRRIADDGPMFAGAVDAETSALTEMLPASALGATTGAVIATNRSLLKGGILILRAGGAAFEWKSVKIPETSDAVLREHPMSRIEVVEKLLSMAAEEFPPQSNRFVLTTKSHGGKSNIMSLLLGVNSPEIDKAKFTADLKQKDQQLFNGLSGPSAAKPHTDIMASMQQKRGISRNQYLNALAVAGDKYAMTFSIVFAESCSSGIGFDSGAELPANVGFLFTSDQKGLFYQTISYRNLLLSNKGPLDELIHAALTTGTQGDL